MGMGLLALGAEHARDGQDLGILDPGLAQPVDSRCLELEIIEPLLEDGDAPPAASTTVDAEQLAVHCCSVGSGSRA